MSGTRSRLSCKLAWVCWQRRGFCFGCSPALLWNGPSKTLRDVCSLRNEVHISEWTLEEEVAIRWISTVGIRSWWRGASCCVKGLGRKRSSKLSITKVADWGQGDLRSRNSGGLELMTASTRGIVDLLTETWRKKTSEPDMKKIWLCAGKAN